MINEKLWFRWKALARAMNTMPKFAALWNRTKLKIRVFLIYGFLFSCLYSFFC
jgi:hypothetical protein